MSFVSFNFLVFALIAVFLLRFDRRFLLLLNAVFFATFFTSAVEAIPMLGMVMLGYVCLHIVARFRAPTFMGILVFLIVLLFAWLKGYALITPLFPAGMSPFVVVGLSYILFRILHLLIDIAQGDKSIPPFLGYLNYCLFFPTFVSGPIQRYEHFAAQVQQVPPRLTVPILHGALCRIILGLMLVVVCSAYASMMVDWLKETRSLAKPLHAEWMKTTMLFSLTSFAVLVKLYTNFSGSMHIVMGIGTLAGFTLPENFNKPYLAKNFLDFWARWHITLSEWIKFYLFNPLLKWLTLHFPSPRAAHYLGAIAFFISFLVIGIWHGTTLLFVVFGFMLGLAATVNKLWQQLCIYSLGKTIYKSLTQRNWYFQLSRGLTLSYISIALMCLWLDPEYIQTNGILWMLRMMVVSTLLMTVGLALVGGIADGCMKLVRQCGISSGFALSEQTMIVTMACMIWLVFNHLGAFGSGTPEFIYKGF